MFLSSTAAAAQQQQHSTAAVVAATSSCCFGPSTPGQTRTPNEENGTPKRDFFSDSLHITSMHCVRISIADRAPRCIADRGTAEAAAQQQQHSSSGGSDVAATDEKVLFYCAVEYAKVTYTLDSSISLQASFFWRFVEHLGLPCESLTVQAVREFFPVSFPVTR